MTLILHPKFQISEVEQTFNIHHPFNALTQQQRRSDLACHIDEYKRLGAYSIQRQKAAAYMAENGMVSRNLYTDKRAFDELNMSKRSLFTLGSDGKSFIFYNRDSQALEIFDIVTKKKRQDIPFPLKEDEIIDLGQVRGMKAPSPFHPDYLVVQIEKASLGQSDSEKYTTQNNMLYAVHLPTGQMTLISDHYQRAQTALDDKFIPQFQALQAQIDEAKFGEKAAIENLKSFISREIIRPMGWIGENPGQDYMRDSSQMLRKHMHLLDSGFEGEKAYLDTLQSTLESIKICDDGEFACAIDFYCRPFLELHWTTLMEQRENRLALEKELSELALTRDYEALTLPRDGYAFSVATYPMMAQKCFDEVVYFYPEICRNAEADDDFHFETKIYSYNLVTGVRRHVKTMRDPAIVTELFLDDHLNIVSFNSDAGDDFKAYTMDQRGQPQLRFTFTAEDMRSSVNNTTADYVVYLDNKDTDMKVPYCKELKKRGEFALLSDEEIADLKSDVKDVMMHPTKPEILIFTTYHEEFEYHIRMMDGSLRTFTEDQVIHEAEATHTIQEMIEYTGISLPLSLTSYDGSTHLLATKDETGQIKVELIKQRTVSNSLEARSTKPRSFKFKARDGLEIQAYLTLPQKAEPKNLPALLLVHGGPASRDKMSQDTEVQFWASRGFAVVQINFRGSKGFGKNFLEAGYGQWHGKMTDDLIDGLDHLIQKGIIDKNQIMAYGASYGAFATASLMTRYAAYFQCGIAINGIYNLLEDAREAITHENGHDVSYNALQYGADLLEHENIARHEAKLLEQSPIFDVAKLQKPLLLISGTEDENCLPRHSQQFAEAAKSLGKQVQHLEFEGEKHIFTPQAARDVAGVCETFVAEQMGSFAEPYSKKRDAESKITRLI